MSSMMTQASPVLFGCGAINELGDKVKEFGGTKAICAYDAGVAAAGIADKIAGILKDAGIETVLFDKIAFETPDDEINKNSEDMRASGADCMIGIGGGSCLDSAKAYAVLMKNPPPISEYYASKIGPFPKPHVPLILIPTNSGTGSEATGLSVVHDTATHTKEAVFGFADLAILDPELTVTAPPKVTAASGMDAMSHALEAFTSNTPSPKSDLLALDAISRIAANLERAVKNGADIEARTELAIASNFAGMAFFDASVHFGHSIAHAFGLEFNMPHGIACALVAPEVIAFTERAVPERTAQIHKALGAPEGQSAADFVRGLMHKIEIPTLASLGISREKCVGSVAACLREWFIIRSSLPVDEAVMEEILCAMYDNYQ